MSKLPLRLLGFVALSIAVSIGSCAAFIRSAAGPDDPPATEHADGRLR